MFWVATAPPSEEGHVNVSGKGVEGTFHVIDNHKVWYEDLTGSGKYQPFLLRSPQSNSGLTGCETISHIRENVRITVYFNAFEGPPRIARLFGKGASSSE